MNDNIVNHAAAGAAAWALVTELLVVIKATRVLPEGAVAAAISNALSSVGKLIGLADADEVSQRARALLQQAQSNFQQMPDDD